MSIPIIPDLLELFPDVVSIRRRTGQDAYGKATYGPSFSVRARVIGKIQEVGEPAGQVTMSKIQVTFAGAFGVTVQDEFTLPSRFTPQVQPAVRVGEFSDENGPHHQMVFF